jgi:hypothetical protein
LKYARITPIERGDERMLAELIMNTYGLKKLTPNPNNPRVLRDDQYKKLLASIKRDPEFLSKRPIVHAEGVILGGNMRYRALLEATRDPEFRAAIGTKKEGEVPASWVLDASEFSEEQRRRFVIVDNAPDGMSGEWDWDVLANEWGDVDLNGLGLDVPEVVDPTFKEYDETATDGLNKCTCPTCGHTHAAKD